MCPFNSLCFFSPSPWPMSRSRFSWEWENTGSLSCPLPFPIHNKQPETMAAEAAGTEDACKGRDICAHRHVLHVRKHASPRTVIRLAVSEVGYRMWNPHLFWNPQSRENLLQVVFAYWCAFFCPSLNLWTYLWKQCEKTIHQADGLKYLHICFKNNGPWWYNLNLIGGQSQPFFVLQWYDWRNMQ